MVAMLVGSQRCNDDAVIKSARGHERGSQPQLGLELEPGFCSESPHNITSGRSAGPWGFRLTSVAVAVICKYDLERKNPSRALSTRQQFLIGIYVNKCHTLHYKISCKCALSCAYHRPSKLFENPPASFLSSAMRICFCYAVK